MQCLLFHLPFNDRNLDHCYIVLKTCVLHSSVTFVIRQCVSPPSIGLMNSSLPLRSFVCTVACHPPSRLWIRSGPLTGNRKCLMMGPCVTSCGPTLKVSRCALTPFKHSYFKNVGENKKVLFLNKGTQGKKDIHFI